MTPTTILTRLAIVLCLCLLPGAFVSDAYGKTLYVNSATGNDSVTYAENGVATPWATLLRATWGNTNRAGASTPLEAAQAGDTVIVTGGPYTVAGQNDRGTPGFLPANNGTSGSRIVFEASGTVSLRLSSSSGPVIGGNASGGAYTTWSGFTLDEQYITKNEDSGPAVSFNVNGIYFERLTIIGQTQTFENNNNAIRIENSRYTRVRNCTITGIHLSSPDENSPAVMVYSGEELLIEHNNISDCDGGIWIKGETSFSNNNNVVRYNLIYDNISYGIKFGYSTGTTPTKIYQNVYYGSAGYCLSIYGDARNGQLVNNTCGGGYFLIHHPHTASYTQGGNVIKNNILYNHASGGKMFQGFTGTDESKFDADYNIYYNGNSITPIWCWNSTDYSNISDYQSAISPDESNSVYQDPLFVNAATHVYTLQAGSPAISFGVDVLDLDNDGNSADAITIGAYITGSEVIGVESASMDSTAYGHVTGVTQPTTATFVSAWSGNGTITGSGDEEIITVTGTQYMATGVLNTGVTKVTLSQNLYRSGDTTVMKWRTCATDSTCTGAWTTYSAPFDSLGYIQLRVEAP